MTAISIRGLDVPVAIADNEDFLRVRLAQLRALEVSLERSRGALLALDLQGIDRGTSEQVVLIRELEAAGRQAAERLAEGRTRAKREFEVELAGDLKGGLKDELDEQDEQRDGLKNETRRSAQRILEGLRLHRALLARVRGKLRILANMLAGTSEPYGELLAGQRGRAQAQGWPGGEGNQSCRA
jgi:hypothetical protein